MNGFLLTSEPFIQIFFREPEVLLFGCLLLFMSAALVLACMVKMVPKSLPVLLSGLFIILLLLIGILTFDLTGITSVVSAESIPSGLSEIFSTHRWLLMPIPILFTTLATILFYTCRNDLKEKHAREYIFAAQFCVFGSFITLLLIGFESLI